MNQCLHTHQTPEKAPFIETCMVAVAVSHNIDETAVSVLNILASLQRVNAAFRASSSHSSC